MTPIIITIAPIPPMDPQMSERPGPHRFDAFMGDRWLCRSWTPFLAGARVLAADGVPPETPLLMRHVGSDTIALISTVGAAAALTVREGDGPMRFTRFQSFDGRQKHVRSQRVA